MGVNVKNVVMPMAPSPPLLQQNKEFTFVSGYGFPSITYPLGVSEGKWFYQVQLKTNGIIQIGWTYHTDFISDVTAIFFFSS